MIALTKGRSTLCLVAVSAQEVGRLLQPGAGVAIAVPVMLRRVPCVVANVRSGSLQGMQQFRKRRIEHGFAPIRIQPVAGFAELTIVALLVAVVEDCAVPTIREINVTLDQPARVLE